MPLLQWARAQRSGIGMDEIESGRLHRRGVGGAHRRLEDDDKEDALARDSKTTAAIFTIGIPRYVLEAMFLLDKIFFGRKILGGDRKNRRRGKTYVKLIQPSVHFCFLTVSVSVSCPTAVFDRQVGYCLN